MSIITFGSFAVDMTSDELTTPPFSSFFPSFLTDDGPDILPSSPTEIVARDPTTGAIVTLRGSFNFSSESALLSSRVTGMRAETSTHQLILDANGFSLTVLQVLTLSAGEIGNLIVGGNDVITGSSLNDHLLGFAGNDQIDGAAGADTMEGGLGNDTFVVAQIGDTVVELAGQGLDTVNAFITHALEPNVENLVLVGAAAINGTGNALDNFLNGSTNSNANQLAGGPGNDTYEVGAGDTVIELFGEGTDTLRSALSDVVMPDNVENIVFLDPNADASATGNNTPNTMTGTSGDNTLDGGRGPDSLAGLSGDDTYYVDSGVDSVTEAASAGLDEIICLVSIVLPANVENGTAAPGTSVVALTGNSLNNVLTGNDGPNLLDGGAGNDTLLGQGGLDVLLGGDGNDLLAGGAGIDVLLGGAGADRFRFDSAPDGGNVEWVMDFAPGTDKLEFSASVFADLGAPGGPVNPDAFVKGAGVAALGPEDRLLYDTSTGRLYYDGDGSGTGDPELVATLQGAPNLAAADLLVIS